MKQSATAGILLVGVFLTLSLAAAQKRPQEMPNRNSLRLVPGSGDLQGVIALHAAGKTARGANPWANRLRSRR